MQAGRARLDGHQVARSGGAERQVGGGPAAARVDRQPQRAGQDDQVGRRMNHRDGECARADVGR